MTAGMSQARLDRMHDVLAAHVARGELPGLVALVSRHGEALVDAIGTLAFDDRTPMRPDTAFRIASLTKPVTAVGAMILVEEGVLHLDQPVDPLLPELASRRVLRELSSPLDDTVPADRPITLRDLLTYRVGYGAILAEPGQHPIQKAMDEGGLIPGAVPPVIGPDEWLRNLGRLPLVCQPGAQWMYHTAADITGILISRATGRSLDDFLRERIFAPLAMHHTGFWLRPEWGPLPRCYVTDPATGGPLALEASTQDAWSDPPAMQSGGGGLISTAIDYAVFCQMLLDGGRHAGGRILSRPSVRLMTTDQLTAADRGPHCFLAESAGWGFGMEVALRRTDVSMSPGRFGWSGGTGTSGYTDPAEDLVGVMFSQRFLESPVSPVLHSDFWTTAYAAIDD
jgi:CubicO group peptidase (beta-lactamase class C family)